MPCFGQEKSQESRPPVFCFQCPHMTGVVRTTPSAWALEFTPCTQLLQAFDHLPRARLYNTSRSFISGSFQFSALGQPRSHRPWQDRLGQSSPEGLPPGGHVFCLHVQGRQTSCQTSLVAQWLRIRLPRQVFLINLFIYWLQWVFVAARRLSLVVVSGATLRWGAWASRCSGFSCCGARALGTWASVVVAHGLSSCGSWA